MILASFNWRCRSAIGAAIICASAFVLSSGASAQQRFKTPEEAVTALVAAVRSENPANIVSVLGRDGREIVASGDDVADTRGRAAFLTAYDVRHQIVSENKEKSVLTIGNQDWPLPIPIVLRNGSWQFDAAAGKEEMLYRRIGRNELAAIQVALAYVDAQNEYASLNPQKTKIDSFAQRIISSPGKKDGLYWPAAANEPKSPLGEAMAAATQQGYRIGGGTPTYLEPAELERLFDIIAVDGIPLSIETSPDTATPERLAVLAERGATRVSIGVQSFDDTEARAAVRPQKRATVESALDTIRAAGIPVLNVDLIYGITGQTDSTWLDSLNAALTWQPEELYLYPLYVRPLTGLAGRETPQEWDEQRMRLYKLGRDHLLAAGYEQQSMRMFRRPDAPALGGEDYACQSDGMVGLGCGARSYTRSLHYSFDYAVSPSAVRGIIDDYVSRPMSDFTRAEVGVRLDADERRRRHLLQSVLQAEGLEKALYRKRFGTDVTDDFRELSDLADRGWLTDTEDRLRLTPEGLAWSDAVGPSLFSPAVRAAMAAYDRR